MVTAAYEFELGPRKATSVVVGFEEAVASMAVGGRRVAIVPHTIGYGALGIPQFRIPPAATLLYYIELLGGSRSTHEL